MLTRPIETPQEGLLHTEDKVELKVNETSLGTGTLFVCEDSFSWRPTNTNQPEGVSVPWNEIISLFSRGMPYRFVFVRLADVDTERPRTELSLIPCEMDSFVPIYDAMWKSYHNVRMRPTRSRFSWSNLLYNVRFTCAFTLVIIFYCCCGSCCESDEDEDEDE